MAQIMAKPRARKKPNHNPKGTTQAPHGIEGALGQAPRRSKRATFSPRGIIHWGMYWL